jgi:hypothetical protein
LGRWGWSNTNPFFVPDFTHQIEDIEPGKRPRAY